MELAVDKCAILNIRGPEKDFELLNQNLNSLQAVKDLGMNVRKKLFGSVLNKANSLLNSIKQTESFT